MSPDNAFDAFFVVSAKPNGQPAEGPHVTAHVSRSREPREWEVFLGRLHMRHDCQLVARHLEQSFLNVASESPAWDQAKGLFELAVRGLPFTPGTVFDRMHGV
jgi:hypothetical protein